MKMSKVGNQTNSQDPQAVNSRVFVGNLNTFQCSKTDVERMFQRYGRLAGISMHKGYAFVQFTNPFDARSACLGEDGRTILSQILDVNMVAEPKPHQTGRKRQNLTKTGNDWDYYYDSYYASTANYPMGPGSRLVPPLKRPRLMVPPGSGTRPAKIHQKNPTINNNNSSNANNNNNNGNNNGVVTGASGNCGGIIATSQQAGTLNTSNNNNGAIGTIGAQTTGNVNNTNNGIQTSVTTTNVATNSINLQSTLDQLKIYSNPDILICGNCREMFNDLHDLLNHKKNYCKLRFTCKCHTSNISVKRRASDDSPNFSDPASAVSLLCVQCKDSFPNAWDLMVHVQAAHMVNIYELGVPKSQSSSASSNEDSSSEPPLSPASDLATNQTKGCTPFTSNGFPVNETSSSMEDLSRNQTEPQETFINTETSVDINDLIDDLSPAFAESHSISIEASPMNQLIVTGR